jgi:hypothetical protein
VSETIFLLSRGLFSYNGMNINVLKNVNEVYPSAHLSKSKFLQRFTQALKPKTKMVYNSGLCCSVRTMPMMPHVNSKRLMLCF